MTELQELDLSLKGWHQEQEKNLCELLIRTRKWDMLKSLKISASPEIKPTPLKKLNISPNLHGPLLDEQIILGVKTHFEGLTCLNIQGRSDELWDSWWTTTVSSNSLSTICDLLNYISSSYLGPVSLRSDN
ncbi:hypothetical protein QWA68_005014 [Fusarium oxysporum]|nr:hypothetical protein QWA68_005014 [Fusarium oxysporum]